MRVFLAFVFALCASLVATTASAQTINVVNETSLVRLNSGGSVVQKRPLNLTPEGVNLQDCVDDQQIRFTLQLADFVAQAQVQVWASTVGDCKTSTSRSSSTGVATCWPLLTGNVPLTVTQDVPIRVRSIMSGVGHPTQPTDTPGLCGTVDLTSIIVHFIYIPPSQTEATVDKAVTVTVDTVGPEPPTGLSVLPGNGRIRVSWNSISGGDPDASTSSSSSSSSGGVVALTGIKVYCDPNVATSTTTEVPNDPICEAGAPIDGGFDDDGGAIDAGFEQICTDGGTRTETQAVACSSSAFTADGGKIQPTKDFDDRFQCGSLTGNSGTTVDATKVNGAALINGKTYAVAVAATDAYGNVGPLSEERCEIPAETTDFWEYYKNAGGGAGGCATPPTASEAPVGTFSFVGIVGALAATMLLRNRKRTRR